MLVGIYVYHIGWLLLLMSIWPVVIFIVEVILLTLQVRSEEKRLEADFGEEYLQYKAITKRY